MSASVKFNENKVQNTDSESSGNLLSKINPSALEIQKSTIATIPDDIATTTYTYSVAATNIATGEVKTISSTSGSLDPDNCFSFSGGKVTFSMGIPFGSWKFVVSIANSLGTTIYRSPVVKREISAANSVFKANFDLNPVQTSGNNGKVKLSMAVPSSVKSVVIKNLSGDDSSWPSGFFTSGEKLLVPVDGSVSIADSAGEPIEVASGSHSVQILFYSTVNPADGVLLFSLPQLINVFDSLTTDVWFNPSTSEYTPITSSGTFNLTENIITYFSLKDFYVSSDSGSEENTGSFYAPAKSISQVVNSMLAIGKSDLDYTINIVGDLLPANGETTMSLPATLNGKVNSITLQGYGGFDENGEPVASINGNKKGSVLTVSTSVPVTVKNLRITNGQAEKGGGIFISSGSSVTLGNGACVEGCTASQNGGGVYLAENAKLFMYGTAKIGGTEAGKGNSAKYGGGISSEKGFVYLGKKSESETESLTGGVYGNTAEAEGGGICINGSAYNSTNLEMHSGTIDSNKVVGANTTGGGGVYLYCTVFELSGGTISENTIESPGTNSSGGAININNVATLKLSGTDTLIPYGGEKYNNDVSIRGEPINVTDSLGEDFNVTLDITDEKYSTGTNLLSGTEEVLGSACSMFVVGGHDGADEKLYLHPSGSLGPLIYLFNGENYGDEIKDGLTYEAYKYSFLSYVNLGMSIVNPYEKSGYAMEVKVNGETPDDLTYVPDGYNTVYVKISKAGCETIEKTKRVFVKIKPVKYHLNDGWLWQNYYEAKGTIYINGETVRSWGSYSKFYDDPHWDPQNFERWLSSRDAAFNCSATGWQGSPNNSAKDYGLNSVYGNYTLADIRATDYVQIGTSSSDRNMILKITFTLTD